MSAANIQLVAVGAQDVYLTSSPQITFFKSVYRRHTNFAIDTVEQSISGTATFGSRISVNIFKTGDLLKNIWIQYNPQQVLNAVIPSTADDIVGANVGHSIISQVDLEINGQIIDTQYGKWMTIWNYLTECDSTGIQGSVGDDWEEPSWFDSAVDYDVERSTRYNIMGYTHRANVSSGTAGFGYLPPDQAYIPLRFWFCRNPGLALPLIALQYSEIKVIITLGKPEGIYLPINGTQPNGNEFGDLKVFADYIFLDSTERRKFAQNAHEYLIEQLQVSNYHITKDINLYFKHPVKEIIWSSSPEPVARGDPNTGRTTYYNVVPGLGSPSKEINDSEYTIILNGQPRIKKNLKYFTRNQIWDCHTGYGSILFPNSIAVYSFALRPEENQPSGTCNFSRIDNAMMTRTTTDPIDIYAVNINVLRIMSGTAGLAYVN
jgi:hypothetical protein